MSEYFISQALRSYLGLSGLRGVVCDAAAGEMDTPLGSLVIVVVVGLCSCGLNKVLESMNVDGSAVDWGTAHMLIRPHVHAFQHSILSQLLVYTQAVASAHSH